MSSNDPRNRAQRLTNAVDVTTAAHEHYPWKAVSEISTPKLLLANPFIVFSSSSSKFMLLRPNILHTLCLSLVTKKAASRVNVANRKPTYLAYSAMRPVKVRFGFLVRDLEAQEPVIRIRLTGEPNIWLFAEAKLVRVLRQGRSYYRHTLYDPCREGECQSEREQKG